MSEDQIVPDTKDWTWSVERQCAECGFDASAVSAADLPRILPALTAPWRDVLAGAAVRQRPEPTTWSPLEYACHIHEVLDVFAGRFELVLAQDNPTLPNWDQDAAAIDGDYGAQDPAVIADEIPERTAALVSVLERFDVQNHSKNAGEASETTPKMGGSAWERTTQRSDGAAFTALTLARYLAHDLAHHLHDVGADDQIPRLGPTDA